MPPEQLQQMMGMFSAGTPGAGFGGMRGMPPGAAGTGGNVIRLTPEEGAAVARLSELGFDRTDAAQVGAARTNSVYYEGYVIKNLSFSLENSRKRGTRYNNEVFASMGSLCTSKHSCPGSIFHESTGFSNVLRHPTQRAFKNHFYLNYFYSAFLFHTTHHLLSPVKPPLTPRLV